MKNKESDIIKLTRAKFLMSQRSEARKEELIKIEIDAIANFKGSYDELMAALGLLRLGDFLGWRVLVVIHTKRTIKQYEEILGIKVRDFFPAEGSQSYRSVGYTIAKTFSNFWKSITGGEKIPNRRVITEMQENNIKVQ